MSLSVVLAAEKNRLKKQITRLQNQCAAIDLLVEETNGTGDARPVRTSTKAPRQAGLTAAVLGILQSFAGAATAEQIAKRMPARFHSALHKNKITERIGQAASALVGKNMVRRVAQGAYELVR
jgi:hypothetical protein